MRQLAVLMSSLGLLAALYSSTLAEEIQPEEVLAAYLELAIAGEWTEAAGCWLPADVERANRLGIRYSQMPFKLDCASPIFLPGALDGGLAALAIRVVEGSEPNALLALVEPSSNPDAWTARYHLIEDGDRWVLASPATALGRDWPITVGRYLNVHVQPGMNYTADQLVALDAFVEKTCSRLGLSGMKLEQLRKLKLDYYLCDRESVEEIVGAPTQGVALLPVDAVVTSDPFHQHELAHLLVNFALGELPLYTLPILQEGAAVHLGGRWGRSPAVMEELGRYVLVSGFAEIDEILTWPDFHGQSADLTYAPSGILAGYLLDELGPEVFLDLYRSMSGSFSDLVQTSSKTIRANVEGQLKLVPGGLESALMEYTKRLEGGGIEPGLATGLDPLVRLAHSQGTAEISLSQDWVGFDIQMKPGDMRGILSLTPKDEVRKVNYSGSRLYEEQCARIPFRGQRAAVVFNPGEAGLYDFALDQLTAKYIQGFRPDSRFFNAGKNRIKFRIRRSDLPFAVDEFNWVWEAQAD